MKISSMTKIIALFLIVAALIPQIYAFGITPSKDSVQFTSDLRQRFEFELVNSEHKDLEVIVYPRGDLADYVNMVQKKVRMTADEGVTSILFDVDVPYSARKPGTNTIEIVVEEIPDNYSRKTVVGGKIALVHQLMLKSPYYGYYLDAKLTTNNPSNDEPVRFTFTFSNEGTEIIDDLTAEVEVFDKNYNSLGIQTYNFSPIYPEQKGKEVVDFSQYLISGEYHAVAKIKYNGKIIKQEVDFAVGGVYIIIESIGSKLFRLGMINEMSISVYNQWSEKIEDVFAEVTYSDESKGVQGMFKTLSDDVNPFATSTLIGYWNTQSLLPGKYRLDVDLKYSGKPSHKTFDVVLSNDGFKASALELSGRAITTEKKKYDSSFILLSISVFALIIINIVLLMYLKGRNNNGNNSIPPQTPQF